MSSKKFNFDEIIIFEGMTASDMIKETYRHLQDNRNRFIKKSEDIEFNMSSDNVLELQFTTDIIKAYNDTIVKNEDVVVKLINTLPKLIIAQNSDKTGEDASDMTMNFFKSSKEDVEAIEAAEKELENKVIDFKNCGK